MSNWIREAEAALLGRPSDDCEVVTNVAPPLLDAALARAAVAPFMAAFLWAGAAFRQIQSHEAMDPLALLFRVLALGLSLRAINLLLIAGARLRIALRRARYGLVLTAEGLLYRTPSADFAVPRSAVLEVRERSGNWSSKSGRRWAEVFVITHPDTGRTFLSLPPIFESTPGVLRETLMRWRGVAEPTPLGKAPSEQLASKIWDQVASGEVLQGVTRVPHGQGWLRRGPYASLLLGAAVLYSFMRLDDTARASVALRPALTLAAALLFVPLAWIMVTRASLAARKGLSFVLTPKELLSRTRAGVQRVAWSKVQRTEVLVRNSWSMLQGAYESRTLLVHLKAEPRIECAEAHLSLPAEVVVGLCDAYRKGALSGAAESEAEASS